MKSFLRDTDKAWGVPQKILFRGGCVYVLLYALAHPFGVPLGEFIGTYYSLLWDVLVPWLGRHVLRLSYEITVKPAGSGDTTYNYAQIIGMLIVSAVAALVWTLLDRKRRDYNALFYWFVVFVRFYLAFVMLTYGFAKVIKAQFPSPSLERLMQPYGESSPMGLLWTFMGYSKGYNLFAGLGEVIGGLLLFFRRTTTLGALVVIGVMSNVVMLNFSYDVPVKLFSVHLLLFAVFLLLLDLRRMVNVFILNRPAPAAKLWSPVSNPRLRIVGAVLKVLVIGYLVATNVWGGLQAQRLYGDARPLPPLYGIYDVETFVQNGDTLAPLLTDPVRWRRIAVDRPGYVSVRKMNDQTERHGFRPDTVAHTLTLFAFADTTRKYTLRYDRPAPGELVVRGVLWGDSLHVRLRQFDLDQYLLVSRGFHWITEYPFNR